MINFFRRFKISYILYNYFNKEKLYSNERVYKELGLKKKYYYPVSSKDFERLSNVRVDLIEASEANFKKCNWFASLSNEDKQSLLNFNYNGFAILRGYLSEEQVVSINQEIDKIIENKEVKFRYRNKIMFAIKKSKLLRNIGNEEKLTCLLSTLLNGEAILFQSINFLKGSQQATHSDTIHMTTYPLGGLLGVWIALEDTNDDNGPLHYYSGSHKLPYLLNKDYNNEGDYYRIGDKSYSDYENEIAKKISDLKLKKEVFFAKKGDLLIWHANLLHGGEPQKDLRKTRKSMVFHYFKKGSVCYHELTQRPALME